MGITNSTLMKELFPGEPTWTAKDMPDLTGRVVCVTGGNSGIGYEICKAVSEHNAKVYLAARSEEKAKTAIDELRKETGKDNVHFLKLDLGNLHSCAAAARELYAKEPKLDILFLNAGVMNTPLGSKTDDGYELQWGTNVVGHFVFAKLLLPSVKAAAKTGVPDATRIVWTSSNGHNMAPKGFVNWDDVNLTKFTGFSQGWTKYGQSKAGNVILANWMAHHLADDGILSFSLNPGGIKTNLVRHTNAFATWLLSFIFHEPWKGAVTPLFAGTSTTLTKKDSGKYFIPWAREAAPHVGIQDPALADKLWDFLEKDTAGKY